MTVPRLVTLLRSLDIFISKRQVVRLLNAGKDEFLTEARDVLRAGLSSADWITVDDTGARHKAANGFCTQIGNKHFAWFGTTGSKSRRNFLELLRAGHSDYVINDEAIAYMRERALAGLVITRLLEHPDRSFADQTAWNAHLKKLDIFALKVNPDPVLIATEGALWGSIKAHGFLPDTVIVSDDAGQFDVSLHALCWVHYLESNLILGILSQRQWIGALGSPGLQINSGLLPRGGVWESAGASVALLQPGTDLVAIRDYLVRAATTSRDGDKPEDEVRRPSNLVSMPVSSLTRPSH